MEACVVNVVPHPGAELSGTERGHDSFKRTHLSGCKTGSVVVNDQHIRSRS